MKKYLIKANLSTSAVDIENGVPSSIEYMPAGTHTIQCSVNGKAKEIAVEVTEATAQQLQASLEAVLKSFNEGNMSKPFIDFDHKGEKAAAFPIKFYWDNGVRLEVEWTEAGREAIAEKTYNYFSPEWFMSDNSVAIASPGAIGALCNVPAFQTIEKISSTKTKENNMSDTDKKPEDKTVEQLTAELTAANEKCATLQAQLDELQKSKEAADTKVADVEKEKEAEVEKTEAEAKKAEAARKELIEYKVDALVKAGRVAAAGKAALVSAALASSDNGKALFAAVPERASASIAPVGDAKKNAEADEVIGVSRAAKGFSAMLAK